MSFVYLGIGSNEGDRQANIDKALKLLKDHKDIEMVSVSGMIETEPEGGSPQGKFLNGAIQIQTELMPLTVHRNRECCLVCD